VRSADPGPALFWQVARRALERRCNRVKIEPGKDL
jgi:hypothetical protein